MKEHLQVSMLRNPWDVSGIFDAMREAFTMTWHQKYEEHVRRSKGYVFPILFCPLMRDAYKRLTISFHLQCDFRQGFMLQLQNVVQLSVDFTKSGVSFNLDVLSKRFAVA